MTVDRPRLETLPGGGHQLIVDGKPFLMRAAELNNSSMSSARFMQDVWPKIKRNNVNTVLGSVSWDQIEPVEGQFDWTELDQVIVDARSHDLRLVLLWFGSFKNGFSQYVPHWVKLDSKRFPRAKIRKAEDCTPTTANFLSVFHPNAREADTKAFGRLMQHILEVDGLYGTVIMVQVENEVGLLGDSRDRSDCANKLFDSPVPKDLLSAFQRWDELNVTIRSNFAHIHQSGLLSSSVSWEQTFGKSKQTDELFMAYHYAKYVDTVAQAGKSIHPIPHFTNAWLRKIPDGSDEDDIAVIVSGGIDPGAYPSGGPVETVLDIWQLFAPSLDFLSPDIYTTDYVKTCERYTHRGQPLFIPEQRRDEHGALRIWSAIGHFNALGTSPFAIDSTEPEVSPFTHHYRLLKYASQYILNARAKGGMIDGFFFDKFEPGQSDPSPSRVLTYGSWDLLIERAFVTGHPAAAFGIIIQTSSDTFFVVGEGFQITFSSRRAGATYTGILSFNEKEVVNEETGEMRTLRMMNGDESRQGRTVLMPSTSPDVGDFCIGSMISAKTFLAECSVYALFD